MRALAFVALLACTAPPPSRLEQRETAVAMGVALDIPVGMSVVWQGKYTRLWGFPNGGEERISLEVGYEVVHASHQIVDEGCGRLEITVDRDDHHARHCTDLFHAHHWVEAVGTTGFDLGARCVIDLGYRDPPQRDLDAAMAICGSMRQVAHPPSGLPAVRSGDPTLLAETSMTRTNLPLPGGDTVVLVVPVADGYDPSSRTFEWTRTIGRRDFDPVFMLSSATHAGELLAEGDITCSKPDDEEFALFEDGFALRCGERVESWRHLPDREGYVKCDAEVLYPNDQRVVAAHVHHAFDICKSMRIASVWSTKPPSPPPDSYLYGAHEPL